MTTFFIITSTEDKASMNMREILLNDTLLKFEQIEQQWHGHALHQLEMVLAKKDWGPFFSKNQIYMGLTDDPLIFLNDLKLSSLSFRPDFLLFASRHTSAAAKPAFLIHSTGNWTDDVKFGGNPNQLSKTSAFLLRSGYLTLSRQKHIKNIEKFSLDMEVTHHGPTSLEIPLIYMELGSSKKEWGMKDPGRVVAHSLIETCMEYAGMIEKPLPKVGVGFGGTHYAPQFQKLLNQKHIAMSFICPKYYIQSLDLKLIEQMIQNTYEPVDYFIIDWKGTNSDDKAHLLPLLEEFDIPIKKRKEF